MRRAGASAEAILAAYNTENLRASLERYPQRIFDARQAVNQARRTLKDAEMERDAMEAELVLLISIETDEKGKPKFSNQQTRDAELMRRKAKAVGYIVLANKVAEAEADLNQAQDTLQMLLDEYQSARIVARLIAAEMSIIGELADMGECDEREVRFEIDGRKVAKTCKEAF